LRISALSNLSYRYRLIFYSTWLALGFFQAAFTGALPDEAYYFMYSRELAWGYFDHPPAVALLIKMGTSIFGGELGLRFFSVLMSGLSIFLLERVVEPVRLGLFYVFISSVAILHFIGFLSIPDSPLMLFTIAFFWLYKKYLNKPSILLAISLGLCSGLMMLSKYHAVLVIGFTVLSNLQLLRKRNFWIAVLVFLITISPHIYWQFENEFISFKYQLIDRAGDPYKFRYTAEYVGTLPFILGPVVSLIMLIGSAILPSKDKFEKALKFCFWGVYIFFFFSSFNGWVEGHWILITLTPGVYFGYKLAATRAVYERIVKVQFWPILFLILTARFIVAFDVLPDSPVFHELKKNYHGKEKWASKIQEKTGDKPVVFLDSYKDPSMYTFQTGIESTSFNTIYTRKNQFTIWNYEEDFRNRKVAVIPSYIKDLDDSVQTPLRRYDFDFIEEYNPITNIWLEPLNFPIEAFAGDTLQVTFKLEKRGIVDFEKDPEYPCQLIYIFYDQSKRVSRIYSEFEIKNSMLNSTFTLPIIIPNYEGEVRFKAGVQPGWIAPGYHSDWQKIRIE